MGTVFRIFYFKANNQTFHQSLLYSRYQYGDYFESPRIFSFISDNVLEFIKYGRAGE